MDPLVLSGLLFGVAMVDLAVGMVFVLPRVKQEQRLLFVVAFGASAFLISGVATAIGLGILAV